MLQKNNPLHISSTTNSVGRIRVCLVGGYPMMGIEMAIQFFSIFGWWPRVNRVVRRGNIPRRYWMSVFDQICWMRISTFNNPNLDHL